jgi:hypothetical protein
VLTTFSYKSTVSTDANGLLDLVAELNYDDARTNAPIAVVMHGYSFVTVISTVRANAQRLRDKGFFAISVALRERDGADGRRDSGGVEIHDIYDAVEAIKQNFAARVNPRIVYMTGYSGGGGNTLSALTKFPDYFNAGAAFFGMSDYGYDHTNGWYFNGAGSHHQSQLRTDIGDPTLGNPVVTDRYHGRASNLASANNPYSEIHLFVNNDEVTCPAINMITYRSNAVARAAFPNEFTNITVHVGRVGLYVDFDRDGTNDANELQYWPHGNPSASQQDAAESWFMGRLLAGQIPAPTLNPSDTLFVAGFVKTSKFECWVGDGQAGAMQLDYRLTASNLTFQTTGISLSTSLTARLTANTAVFSNQVVHALVNSNHVASFVGGGNWTRPNLHPGDLLALVPTGPALLWWENLSVTNITTTGALARVTLVGTNADVTCYYGTNYPGQQPSGWGQSNNVGSALAPGPIATALTNLQAGTTYYVAFYATNGVAGQAMWSNIGTFTSAPTVSADLVAYYKFDSDFNDTTTNAYHGAVGGVRVTFTNNVPAPRAGPGAKAIVLDGGSWVALPFLDLYGIAQSDGLSVSLWIKSADVATSWFLAEGNTADSDPVYVFGVQDLPALHVYIRTDSGSVLRNRYSAGTVFDNTWHHLVWTDIAGDAKLYVDGTPADSAGFSYPPGTLTRNTTAIGALLRRTVDGKYPFTGWIDDVSVWRGVLSTNDIDALAGGASPAELAGIQPPGPSGYVAWQMQYFGCTNCLDASLTANPAGDGLPNLIKYALGLDPTIATANPIQSDLATTNGYTYLRLSTPRDPNVANVLIEGLSAGALTNWTTDTIIESNTLSFFRVRDALPVETNGQRFLKLGFAIQ